MSTAYFILGSKVRFNWMHREIITGKVVEITPDWMWVVEYNGKKYAVCPDDCEFVD